MSASQWAVVVDRVAVLTAATAGFRLKGDTTAGRTVCVVHRGPRLGGTQGTQDPGDWLTVGWVGDGDPGGTWTQEHGPLAATAGRPRDEVGVVRCRASVKVGNLDPMDALTRAQAIAAAVEQVLRDDPTLGLVPPLSRMYAQMGGSDAVGWGTDSRGPTCDLLFNVNYRARI